MKKAKSRNILLLIVVLLLVFAGIDRLLAGLFINNSDRSFRTSHYYYHHGLIANQKSTTSWYGISYPMITNSLGFRDSLVRDVPLQSTKKRILFMGDSHTEGVGMNFRETFTGQLAGMIDTAKVEILNAAAVSYSPRIYYLKTKFLLEKVSLDFDELFVFIDLSDIQNEIVYQHFKPENPGTFNRSLFKINNRFLNKSFTAHTLSKLRQKRKTEQFLKKAAVFDEYRQDKAHVDALELYASFFSGFDDKTLLSNPNFHGVSGWLYDDDFKKLALKGLELGKENLIKLVRLCKQHGIKMTISVHPWQQQIKMMNKEDLYVRFWKEVAEEEDIGFVNLYPVFINPPVSAVFGMEYFIPGDNHWNKNGHWLVANELKNYVTVNK